VAFNISLDWKITLYDRDRDYKNQSRSYDKSGSGSNSRSVSPRREESTPSNNFHTGEPRSTKVREVWVGNLPSGISEQTLYNNFFIYGEIARLDLHSEKVRNMLNP
jgi:RNA recognition motif-containing protein